MRVCFFVNVRFVTWAFLLQEEWSACALSPEVLNAVVSLSLV